MPIRASILLILLSLSPFADGAEPPVRPRYDLSDLGAATEQPRPKSTRAYARGLNAKGQVVGNIVIDGRTRAFVWEEGRRAYLAPPEIGSAAHAINDRGQILMNQGPFSKSPPTQPVFVGYEGHWCLWEKGQTIDLGFETAFSVNNRGQVLGARKVDGAHHLFLWESGRLTDLSRQGVNGYIVPIFFDLNDRGQVVGHSSPQRPERGKPYEHDEGFFWEEGRSVSLGRFIPVAINNRGQIAGHSRDQDPWYPAIRDGGATRRLDFLPNRADARVMAINERGEVVGHAYDPGRRGQRAVLWAGAAPLDLNDAIPAGSGWVLEAAYDINDRGQIVGDGRLDGEQHAFLLTPR